MNETEQVRGFDSHNLHYKQTKYIRVWFTVVIIGIGGYLCWREIPIVGVLFLIAIPIYLCFEYTRNSYKKLEFKRDCIILTRRFNRRIEYFYLNKNLIKIEVVVIEKTRDLDDYYILKLFLTDNEGNCKRLNLKHFVSSRSSRIFEEAQRIYNYCQENYKISLELHGV